MNDVCNVVIVTRAAVSHDIRTRLPEPNRTDPELQKRETGDGKLKLFLSPRNDD